MGFSFHKGIFFFAIMLIIYGYFFSKAVDATVLEDVCRMTYDEAFCLIHFGSKPIAKTAPILVLAKLAIGDVIDNMNMTRITIEFLLYFSVDPQARNILTDCKNSYVPALSSLVASAYYNLDHGQYRQLGQQATQAFNAAEHCRSAYAAYFLKAPFKSHIYDLNHLSNILEVITHEFL